MTESTTTTQTAQQAWDALQEAPSYAERFAQRPGEVQCEACGTSFKPEHGYHEEGEYSYCPDCCHW